MASIKKVKIELPKDYKPGLSEIAGGRNSYGIEPKLKFSHDRNMIKSHPNKKVAEWFYELIRKFRTISAYDNVKLYELLTLETSTTSNSQLIDWNKETINELNVIQFCTCVLQKIQMVEQHDELAVELVPICEYIKQLFNSFDENGHCIPFLMMNKLNDN